VKKYVEKSAPLMVEWPQPETYMGEVVGRLKGFGLTKTEVFSIVNLGIGMPRPQVASGEGVEMDVDGEQVDGEEGMEEGNDAVVAELSIPKARAEAFEIKEDPDVEGEAHGEVGVDGAVNEDPSAGYLLSLVVEGIEERFTQEQREGILSVLRECVLPPAVEQDGEGTNGTT
jgi:hypothetical protein